MNPILDAITAIFQPIVEVIDHLTVSGDAKVALQQKVIEGQIAASTQMMTYELQLLDAQKSIVVAEAQGNSWLQRSWRPITMLTFLALVVADSVGALPFRLAEQAWELLKLGLGGYVIGRSAEKVALPIVSTLTSAMKK